MPSAPRETALPGGWDGLANRATTDSWKQPLEELPRDRDASSRVPHPTLGAPEIGDPTRLPTGAAPTRRRPGAAPMWGRFGGGSDGPSLSGKRTPPRAAASRCLLVGDINCDG